MPVSPRSLPIAVHALLLSLAALGACGGRVTSDLDAPTGRDPATPPGSNGQTSPGYGGSGASGNAASGSPGDPGAPITCEAHPVCPDGYVEVKDCGSRDCVHVTACDTTILCGADPSSCLGPQPTCAAGDAPVASAADCPRTTDPAARCYSRSSCHGTLWCAGPTGTDAGAP